MTVISYGEARDNLKAVLHQVHDNQETITIVQKNGKHAIIMPEQEYNRLMETMYLLQSPKNAERLQESVRQLQLVNTRPN
ncbi:type II toxin-antitoxin system prevent-host-death family antitoxin [Exiguobacterium sp. SH3S2]|uniref:type II toxin-antitoxin system Phd/YefM family antitoxin n=1 Tax=unclassified Exiguobacterium TaxID=2644629 RepID=UPI0010409D6E|nr:MULTISPECIES: type II toxin-antitoxin system prevent-host-death family antitoxin [unclassified Exiguobacterium]TCI41997.1 type II toxin-antitoxin system prevent-host-death family antitoxin [Exiguobacterium sp. SH3S3]TCI52118.1 type II toxin-antitoxin system prevent-host-death family antitoxin [Exiguobacterium sp. SH5S13]TCI58299.1 type II toxin-antitoxin system prevent-host-death family antitoxin [Exiguobacterium sp. SH3S2]